MSDEIGDEEVILRRVARVHIQDGVITHEGMLPHRVNDADGMSFSRAIHDTPQAMVDRTSRKDAAVFAVTAGEVRSLGLSVVASPLPDQPGHCHIPELNSNNRKHPETHLRANLLASLLQKNLVLPPR